MADYAGMYKVLFRAATKAIEDLQAAQAAAEEIYMRADETPITLLPPLNVSETKDDNQTPKQPGHLPGLSLRGSKNGQRVISFNKQAKR